MSKQTENKQAKSPMPRAEVSRRGGSVTAAESPGKAAALAALHESRRGVRVNPLPRRVSAALVAARVLLDTYPPRGPLKPLQTSLKAFAREHGVDERSVRRWLQGSHNPEPTHHAALLAWVDVMKKRAAALDAAEKKGILPNRPR